MFYVNLDYFTQLVCLLLQERDSFCLWEQMYCNISRKRVGLASFSAYWSGPDKSRINYAMTDMKKKRVTPPQQSKSNFIK